MILRLLEDFYMLSILFTCAHCRVALSKYQRICQLNTSHLLFIGHACTEVPGDNCLSLTKWDKCTDYNCEEKITAILIHFAPEKCE